jgi:soluble lytic murein transglycosylase-like protein
MTLFRSRYLLACVLAVCSGAAGAAVYGKVENGRVSVLYSDTQPADPSYQLYSRSNRFVVHPGAWRKAPRAQAQAQVQAPYVPSTKYDQHIRAAAAETNVEAALIRAVISVESGYNASARSPKGAMGLMQLMPKTAERYGVKDIRDPAQNIQGGARYLRELMTLFGNDLKLVLAAYNAGEEAVMKYGRRIPPFAETVAYVPKVLGHYKKALAAEGI